MKNSALLAIGLTALAGCEGMQKDQALKEYAGKVHPAFLAAIQECPKDAEERPVTGERNAGTASVECLDTNKDNLIDVKRSRIKTEIEEVCLDKTGRTFRGPECEKL
jgi:hypothetical protein